ncbi:MAG TPA: hypothetical protein VJ837_04775 [Candidatus Paceibacterota bacterium]|nr:hypothetical protein [Candidatus Paceibacterota bacterium]
MPPERSDEEANFEPDVPTPQQLGEELSEDQSRALHGAIEAAQAAQERHRLEEAAARLREKQRKQG